MIPRWTGSIFLLAIGLLVLPFGWSWFETPKIWFSLSFLFLYFCSGLFFQKNIFPRRRTAGHIFLVALWLFSLLTLVAFRTPTAVLGNIYRHQGLLTLWALIGLAYCAPFFAKQEYIARFAPVALVLTALGAVLMGADESGRALGTLGEPNALGAAVVFLIPMAVQFFDEKKQHVRALLFLVGGIGVILLSSSRSAMLGAILSLSFLFLAKRAGALRASVIVLILFCCTLTLPFFEGGDIDQRSEVWRTAYAAGWQRPIAGWGFGNIEHALALCAQDVQSTLRYQFVDSSHNIFLDFWVQGGVVGLGIFVTILSTAFYKLVRAKNIIILAALIGMLTVASFNPLSIVGLLYLWWSIGMGLSDNTISRT